MVRGSKEHKIPLIMDKSFLKSVYYSIFDPIISPIRIFIERSKRALAYAKFGYSNPDFDSSYLYDLMKFKLERIRTCLVNGIAVQQEEDMKALDEAIKTLDRIRKEYYADPYYDAHNDKWGEPTITWEPHFVMTRNKVTPETEEQEKQEFFEIWQKAENDRQKDLDKLAKFMKENLHNLWE